MPGTHPLNLYRGDTYVGTFVLWADVDKTIPFSLTGQTPRAQIRRVVLGPELLIELVCSTESPNVVHAQIPASAWDTVEPFLEGVWDLELRHASGTVQTILAGPVRVSGDVTAAP